MTLHYTDPEGPLVSWGGITFKVNRSLSMPTDVMATNDESMDLLGNFNQTDMAGYATLSSHGLYTWQYDMFCGPGESATSVQDEITALVTAFRTPNSDGTTGQVALLTVKLLGYATQTATGIARLLTMSKAQSKSTWKRYNLTFKVPAGFSYTT